MTSAVQRGEPALAQGVLSPFSTTETDAVRYVAITAGGLSLLGSIFIAYCFLSFRKQLAKVYLARLVFFMAVANALGSTCWVMGVVSIMISFEDGNKVSSSLLPAASSFPPPGTQVCSVAGPLLFYSYISTIFWIMAIATENAW